MAEEKIFFQQQKKIGMILLKFLNSQCKMARSKYPGPQNHEALGTCSLLALFQQLPGLWPAPGTGKEDEGHCVLPNISSQPHHAPSQLASGDRKPHGGSSAKHRAQVRIATQGQLDSLSSFLYCKPTEK